MWCWICLLLFFFSKNFLAQSITNLPPFSQEYSPRSSCLMCDKMYAGQRSSVSQSRPNRSVMTGGGFEADYYTNYPWSWTHLHLHIITGPSSSNIYSHTKFIVLNAKRYHNQTKLWKLFQIGDVAKFWHLPILSIILKSSFIDTSLNAKDYIIHSQRQP